MYLLLHFGVTKSSTNCQISTFSYKLKNRLLPQGCDIFDRILLYFEKNKIRKFSIKKLLLLYSPAILDSVGEEAKKPDRPARSTCPVYLMEDIK